MPSFFPLYIDICTFFFLLLLKLNLARRTHPYLRNIWSWNTIFMIRIITSITKKKLMISVFFETNLANFLIYVFVQLINFFFFSYLISFRFSLLLDFCLFHDLLAINRLTQLLLIGTKKGVFCHLYVLNIFPHFFVVPLHLNLIVLEVNQINNLDIINQLSKGETPWTSSSAFQIPVLCLLSVLW